MLVCRRTSARDHWSIQACLIVCIRFFVLCKGMMEDRLDIAGKEILDDPRIQAGTIRHFIQ